MKKCTSILFLENLWTASGKTFEDLTYARAKDPADEGFNWTALGDYRVLLGATNSIGKEVEFLPTGLKVPLAKHMVINENFGIKFNFDTFKAVFEFAGVKHYAHNLFIAHKAVQLGPWSVKYVTAYSEDMVTILENTRNDVKRGIKAKSMQSSGSSATHIGTTAEIQRKRKGQTDKARASIQTRLTELETKRRRKLTA